MQRAVVVGGLLVLVSLEQQAGQVETGLVVAGVVLEQPAHDLERALPAAQGYARLGVEQPSDRVAREAVQELLRPETGLIEAVDVDAALRQRLKDLLAGRVANLHVVDEDVDVLLHQAALHAEEDRL